ncbi:MAG: hypothetical protein MZU95_10760 [Desulfomicrobium escambiense]|nr:hypothetical protein [Desulfomicrobium escambiense]
MPTICLRIYRLHAPGDQRLRPQALRGSARARQRHTEKGTIAASPLRGARAGLKD